MNKTTKKALSVSLGIFMMLGGLFLLYYVYFSNGKVPYYYTLVKTGKLSDYPEFSELAIYGGKDPFIKKYELKLSGNDETIATLFTAEENNSPTVVMDYQTSSPIPFLMLPVKNETYKELYGEITENTEEDALILSWWDHSLRIKLFTGRRVLFNEFMGEPLFIPEEWQKQTRTISAFENEFWEANISKEGEERFEIFKEALLSSEEDGYRILKDLAGNQRVYLVVDQKDILKLSKSAKDNISAAYEDFSFTGDMHGITKRVKNWLKSEELEHYMVEQISENIVRVYYLTSADDKDRLLVKLLPFTSSNPFKLDRFKIRYQSSSYWVFELI